MKGLVRFSPTSDLRFMQREIDRLFDDFFPAKRFRDDAGANVWSPSVDMTESNEAYVIHVEVPGMTRDGFNVNWQEGLLTVSGERQWSSKDEDEKIVRLERNHGRFHRSFWLGKAIDNEHISASYQAGVLIVRVPKAKESRPRRIEIS